MIGFLETKLIIAIKEPMSDRSMIPILGPKIEKKTTRKMLTINYLSQKYYVFLF